MKQHSSNAIAALATAALVLCFLAGRAAAFTQAERDAFQATIGTIDATLGSVETAMLLRLNATASASCSRSLAACGATASALAGYSIDFSAPVQGDYDFVQSYVQAEPPSAAELDIFCRAQRMRDTWRDQLTEATGRRGNILFQYYADAVTQAFGLYPPQRWNCSATYVPSQRPWYVAGATGQRDLVILIDVSDDTSVGSNAAARVATAVRGAKALMATLSFRDYVAVVPYTTFGDESISPDLVQATAANVAQIGAKLDRLRVVAGSTPKLAAGVRSAVRILRTAEVSSRCAKVVVALASSDVGAGADAAVELKAAGDVIGVAFQVLGRSRTPTETQAILGLRRLACGSAGVSAVTDPAAVETDVLLVNAHLTRLQRNDAVRWSEVYTDAFGQGDILTGARAIYYANGTLRGMVGMDVSLSTVNAGGALSRGDVDQLLLALQQCDAIDLSSDTVATAQGAQCDGVSVTVPESEELSDRKLKGLWVVMAIVFPGALFSFGPVLLFFRARYACSIFHMTLKCTIAGCFIWLMWVFTFFFTTTFDDVVARNNYDAVEYRTVRREENPFRCCEQRNCQCTEYSGATSCGSLISELAEGTCGGGYRCCREESYQCNCRRSGRSGSRRCSTCYRCVGSVGNTACQVVCGQCSTPTATIEYTYEGVVYQLDRATSCGLNASGCIQEHFAEYPAEGSSTGYVDPSNPTDMRLNVEVDSGSIIALLVMGLATLVAWIASIVFVFLTPRDDPAQLSGEPGDAGDQPNQPAKAL